MTTYQAYMAKQIAEEIKAIKDPVILGLYLHAIVAQRCAIGGAQEGICKGCLYPGNECRELYRISKQELIAFSEAEEINND